MVMQILLGLGGNKIRVLERNQVIVPENLEGLIDSFGRFRGGGLQ